MLNVNMMCPQNRCAPVVPVGIMPLLPASDSPSPSPTSGTRAKQIPSTLHHHHHHNHFDDDLASMSSITPPSSSPSDHSPNMAPIPFITTDEEGQLIFQFSTPDEEPNVIHEAHEATHSLAFASDLRNRRHGKNGLPCAVALSEKLSTIAGEDALAPPFPVPPSQPTPSHSHAALTLTPSFFTLPPPTTSSSSSSDVSPSNDSPSSPFPFAPPVPTTNGLSIQPASAMTMTLSDTYAEHNKLPDDSNVHATNTPPTTSPITSPLNQHHRSTSSSASTITPKLSPTSPLSTPHASPTLRMRSSNNTNSNNASAATPPVAGPLAALQLQYHPRSPQLSGLPSPSLIPPSPLSLYPPSMDLNTNPGTTPAGFFPERKKGIVNTAITGHVKRASGSGLARPTSPVVKPLKS